MDNKNIIIAILIALVIILAATLSFSIINTNNTSQTLTNNTTNLNDTNDTVNATLTNTGSSSNSHSSRSSGGWIEEQDLSELYGDGERHTVKIYHDGQGGISWTDDLGHHTGREGDIQSW